MTKAPQKIYCSLDIETSGFDPLKNEILEVGFVFFELQSSGISIVREWTKVFKPERQVMPSILGLTGITQQELDNAPKFSEFKQELQDHLGQAVIVGHNVVFDIKFLEAAGIKFSGEVIDTLDLVQFILPTHHSYNLENLMHYFSVEHANAHRALADSKATLTVLEKLLQTFHGFPKPAKDKVLRISKTYHFAWADLLGIVLEPLNIPSQQPETAREASGGWELKTKTIYNFPLGENCLESLVPVLLEQKQKVLLVVPKNSQVLALRKQNLAGAAFLPDSMFDQKKLKSLESKKNLTPEQAKFLLKVLVWQATNWQTDSTLDLNLSFFGGQFKTLVTGKALQEQKEPKIVCCDLQTFGAISARGLYKKRFIICLGLYELEQYISSGMSTKLSWSYILYILKSFYNPEIGSGNIKLKEVVTQGLAAADLFFGLTGALLKTAASPFQYFKVTPDVSYSENYGKVQAAAGNFVRVLGELNEKLDSKEIANFAQALESFFLLNENLVKWVELADTRCVFFSSPLDISQLQQQLFTGYKHVAMVDALGTDKILKFFSDRLGFKDFLQENVEFGGKPKTQGDLFQSVMSLGKSVFDFKNHETKLQIHCHIQPSVAAYEDILKILTPQALPAAILFGGSLQIREFYEQHYQNLQKYAFLVNQTTSGGSSKIFHNFAIHKNSLLIGSDKLILKHLQSGGGLSPVEHLRVKTLVLCRLPFEQFTHPYQEALSARFSNAFEDFSLPKAMYNFHSLLDFFYTDQLQHIYLCDAKMAKGYAKVFIDYLKRLPRVELV